MGQKETPGGARALAGHDAAPRRVPACVGTGGQWDLIVTLDDATTELHSAVFVDEDGTRSSVQGLREVIERKGLFSSLYADRGSHSWYTETAGGKVDTTRWTQVHRALRHLGITLIAAYSPEARGRSEHTFRTLQDRLPKELAQASITDRAPANQFLRDRFVPAYNQRVAIPAAEVGTAFIPGVGSSLADMRCVQEDRVVANDNTVRDQGRSLQIPPNQHRFHYVKGIVRVHEYPDGTLAVFQGPRCLAHYHADGRLSETAVTSERRKKPTARSRDRPRGDPRAMVRERISVPR